MPPDEALAKAHQVEAGFVFHASDGERLRRLVEAIDKRDVTILIDRKVPLDRFADAFAHQAPGRARGYIIVEVDAQFQGRQPAFIRLPNPSPGQSASIPKIGRANVSTPVTNSHLVSRVLPEK